MVSINRSFQVNSNEMKQMGSQDSKEQATENAEVNQYQNNELSGNEVEKRTQATTQNDTTTTDDNKNYLADLEAAIIDLEGEYATSQSNTAQLITSLSDVQSTDAAGGQSQIQALIDGWSSNGDTASAQLGKLQTEYKQANDNLTNTEQATSTQIQGVQTNINNLLTILSAIKEVVSAPSNLEA